MIVLAVLAVYWSSLDNKALTKGQNIFSKFWILVQITHKKTLSKAY